MHLTNVMTIPIILSQVSQWLLTNNAGDNSNIIDFCM